MTDRDAIKRWLSIHTPTRWADAICDEAVNKAGLIPYVIEPQAILYLMHQPNASKPELGPPGWQICKGTRMRLEAGRWTDIRKPAGHMESAESLQATALREAIEELGIKLENLLNLHDIGNRDYHSATRGNRKTMRLFLSQVQDKDNFLPLSEIATSTQDRRWMSAEEFRREGREDFIPIMNAMDAIVKELAH